MTDDPLTFGNLFGSMRGAEFAPSDYEQGQRDMLAKCIEAVDALEPETQFSGPYQMRRAAVAVLRALQDNP